MSDTLEWIAGLIEAAARQPLWKSDQTIGVPFYRLIALRDKLEAAEADNTRLLAVIAEVGEVLIKESPCACAAIYAILNRRDEDV